MRAAFRSESESDSAARVDAAPPSLISSGSARRRAVGGLALPDPRTPAGRRPQCRTPIRVGGLADGCGPVQAVGMHLIEPGGRGLSWPHSVGTSRLTLSRQTTGSAAEQARSARRCRAAARGRSSPTAVAPLPERSMARTVRTQQCAALSAGHERDRFMTTGEAAPLADPGVCAGLTAGALEGSLATLTVSWPHCCCRSVR